MTALADASAEIGLMAHLESLADGIQIVWPNTEPYQPDLEDSYYRVSFLAVPSTRLGFGNADEHKGLLQIDCVVPVKTGMLPALVMARRIQSHFDRQNIIENGVKVQIIEAPSIEPHQYISLNEKTTRSNWYMIPVSIVYSIMN